MTTPAPAPDACCGHNQFNGLNYNSQVKTCCEDGTTKPYGEEGVDPCVPVYEEFEPIER